MTKQTGRIVLLHFFMQSVFPVKAAVFFQLNLGCFRLFVSGRGVVPSFTL